jgi:hypothetical protein
MMGDVRVERDVPYIARQDGPMTGTLYRPAAGEGPTLLRFLRSRL